MEENNTHELLSQDSASEWRRGIDETKYVDPAPVAQAARNIKTELNKVLIDMDQVSDLLIAGLFVGGHVLLEGLPGIAKTLAAKLLARTIRADYSRIQFTPDLMPTDVTGTSVFDLKTSQFSFRRGPIFSNVVLIDEINRAPAKTQAALMEVMEEKQITYDGEVHKMGFPFFVIATQNPVEQEGTYSLPEAQLDRFVFRIKVAYPVLEAEKLILRRFESDFEQRSNSEVQPILGPTELTDFKQRIERIFIRSELMDYIAAIVHNTRVNGDLFLGASPRASLSILRTAKAFAAMQGRDFVTPDDIRRVSVPVLNHRIVLSHEREMEGHTVEEIIDNITKEIEIPR
jgi:MoxR-like ATPase